MSGGDVVGVGDTFVVLAGSRGEGLMHTFDLDFEPTGTTSVPGVTAIYPLGSGHILVGLDENDRDTPVEQWTYSWRALDVGTLTE